MAQGKASRTDVASRKLNFVNQVEANSQRKRDGSRAWWTNLKMYLHSLVSSFRSCIFRVLSLVRGVSWFPLNAKGHNHFV